jgi:hypothetical protein
MTNADISNYVNPTASHTAPPLFSTTSIGGRRRRTQKYKSRVGKKNYKSRTNYKKRRTNYKRKKTNHKRRTSSRQRGGLNPTYRSYSASFEPGRNGMYANGPSVGNIIEQFN